MEIAIASGLVTYERIREGIEVGLHYLSFDRREFITCIHVAAEVGSADEHATRWAKEHGISIVRYWPTRDDEDGFRARNRVMLEAADALIAIIGSIGNCSGVIQMARQRDMLVYVHVKDHGL